MATNGTFDVSIRGKGAHGAQPHLAVDPILISAAVVQQLQTIISRNVNPLHAGVVTVGVIQGGTAENIIPDSVRLQGTWRALTDEVAALLPRRIRKIIRNVVRAHGGTCDIHMMEGYPLLRNDPQTTTFVRDHLRRLACVRRVETCDPMMGGEDFAHYLRQSPGTFFWLGVRRKRHPEGRLHTPNYQPDEEAILVGMQALAHLAHEYLQKDSSVQSV